MNDMEKENLGSLFGVVLALIIGFIIGFLMDKLLKIMLLTISITFLAYVIVTRIQMYEYRIKAQKSTTRKSKISSGHN